MLRSIIDGVSIITHRVVIHKRFAECDDQIQALVPHQISGARFRAPFFDELTQLAYAPS